MIYHTKLITKHTHKRTFTLLPTRKGTVRFLSKGHNSNKQTFPEATLVNLQCKESSPKRFLMKAEIGFIKFLSMKSIGKISRNGSFIPYCVCVRIAVISDLNFDV